jgi:hypothetical protein
MTDDDGGLPHATHSLAEMADPGAALRDAAATLAPGGSVVLRVPNAAHVDVRVALPHRSRAARCSPSPATQGSPSPNCTASRPVPAASTARSPIRPWRRSSTRW